MEGMRDSMLNHVLSLASVKLCKLCPEQPLHKDPFAKRVEVVRPTDVT